MSSIGSHDEAYVFPKPVSSAAATTMMTPVVVRPVIDAGALRQALRVIHCIQKERGASCAYRAAASKNPATATAAGVSSVASNNNHNNEKNLTRTQSALGPARRDTDRAFAMLLSTTKISFLGTPESNHIQQQQDSAGKLEKATLQKIRNMITEQQQQAQPNSNISSSGKNGLAHAIHQHDHPFQVSTSSSSRSAAGFHQILVCFSTLIQSLLHEHVLKPAAVATTKLRGNMTMSGKSSSNNKINRRAALLRRSEGSHHHTNNDTSSDDKISRTGSDPALTAYFAQASLAEFCSIAAAAAMDSGDQQYPPLSLHRPNSAHRTNHSKAMMSLSSSAPSRLPTQFDFPSTTATLNDNDLASRRKILTQNSITKQQQILECEEEQQPGFQSDQEQNHWTMPAALHGDFSPDAHISPHRQNGSLDDENEGKTFLQPVRFDSSFTVGAKIEKSPTAPSSRKFKERGDKDLYDSPWPNENSSFDNITPVDPERIVDDSDDESRIVQLLNLLETFVRLKESTGVERAILSSMIAAGQGDSRLMLTDLLLELENQRRHVGKLAKLLPKTGVLYNLVRELVSLSPQMKLLQNSIAQGFDLDSFKNKFDSHGELWGLLTLYIDKLHSLELILVEEIESCAGTTQLLAHTHDVSWRDADGETISMNPTTAVTTSTSGIDKQWLFNVLGLDARCSNDDIRNFIEAMSPVDIKKRLLSAWSADQIQSNDMDATHSDSSAISQPTTAEANVNATVAKGVDDLLAQLSKAPASKEWEIDLYEIRFLKRIGQGNAGTTYLADWSGLQVAVKVASISELGLDGWRTEVQALQKLHHPNIIRLLGSVCHPSPLTFCLVLEYCDAGDLSKVLKRATPNNFFFRVSDGMAKGGTYLHKKGIIHRDIKPGNVLLEGDVSSGLFNVKLTDFGVATDVSLSSEERTAETGTYRWMAGEVIRHESYSQSADVYSFAVVMWQLITREEPFQNNSQIEAASAVAFENARPPFPKETPAAIVKLIEQCWDNNPNERLSFENIIAELQSLEKSITMDEKIWIETTWGHTVYQVKPRPTASVKHALLKQTSIPKLDATDKKKKGLRTLFNRKSVHF